MRWLLILLASVPAAAQPSFPLEALSSDEGMSLHLTYAVHQDRHGLMWFGTMHGLLRYDGIRYRVFRRDPSDSLSISHDDIVSINEDRNGYLWIGTFGGGLNRLDPRTSEFLRFPNDHSDDFRPDVVWEVNDDSSGNLWVATDEGIYRFRPAGRHYQISKPESFPSSPVHHILIDHTGNIWFGFVDRGLWRLESPGGRVTNYPLDLQDSTTTNYSVTALLQDQKGRVCVGTRWGLCFVDTMSGTVHRLTSTRMETRLPVSRLLEDENGDLWVGTFGRGLYRFSDDFDTVTEFRSSGNSAGALLGNWIFTLNKDRSGIIWIGTYYGGIQKYSPGRFKFRAESSLIGQHVLSTMFHADGSLWIGHQGGLDVLSGKKPQITVSSINPSVTALLQTRSGDVWIGTAMSGLFRYRQNRVEHYRAGKSSVLTSNNVSRLMEDRSGRVWIGTNGSGLYSFLDDAWRKEGDRLPNPSVLALGEDRRGRVWVGTYGGLSVRDSIGNFRNYRHQADDSTSLSHDYVYSIVDDGRGRLWIGTANGLNRYDEATSSFRRWDESDGLPNPVISDIRVRSDHRLWLMTHRGIVLFDEVNGPIGFDIDDGLPGNVFNPGSSSAAADGRMAAGSTRGLVIFHPDSIRLSSYEPTISITGVNVHGRTARQPLYPDSVQLEAYESSLTVQFASSDYTAPRRNRFAVRLEPLDDEWTTMDRMEMSYFHLPPGDYVFRVRGSNSDGIWSDNEDRLWIIVRPPFYRTWWFGTILGTCLIITMGIVHRRRVQMAIRMESMRREEENRVRLRISQDFHDELGHDLTRINLFTELLRRSIGEASGQISTYLNKVTEASSRLSLNARNLIWALDPDHDSLYDLALHLQRFGEQLFEDGDIEFSIEGLVTEFEQTRMPMSERREMALIVKEALHNALRHSEARHVKLTIRRSEPFLEITVEDDGIGIPGPTSINGSGMANMRARARRLKGEFNVETEKNKGVRVVLRIPAGVVT